MIVLKSTYKKLEKENHKLESQNLNILEKYALLELENLQLKKQNNDFEFSLKKAREHFREMQRREKELLSIEITPEFSEARNIISSGFPFVLITGGAGTGKSQFIKTFLKASYKLPVVAPTGIAALNVNGKTIHSLFHFAVANYATPECVALDEKNFNRIHDILRLVIDEISMVRADMMDLIDYTLRQTHDPYEPFGGVQIIAIGDLYQLPPVVKDDEKQFFNTEETESTLWEKWPDSYFFNAFCMQDIEIKHIEFTKIFRQDADEKEYIACLNNVRLAKQNEESVKFLNQRANVCANEYAVQLLPHRLDAERINNKELNLLPGEVTCFCAKKLGSYITATASDLPAPDMLQIKIGAKIMFVNNNNDDLGNPVWVNGTMGKVTDIISKEIDKEIIEVEILGTEGKHRVCYATWEDKDYDQNKKLRTIGTFQQLPIMLAWAFTVHKVQGKTCNQIIYSPHKTFGPGMAYVALSRTKKLSDLHLKSKLEPGHIISNRKIDNFLKCLNKTVKK